MRHHVYVWGGLKITTQTQVLDVEEQPILGLSAAGELVGGIFYFNYVGGNGLMNGPVFEGLAGENPGSYSVQK